MTTPEIQLGYKVWKPKGNKYYCENCEEWLKRKPHAVPEPLPDEPMF